MRVVGARSVEAAKLAMMKVTHRLKNKLGFERAKFSGFEINNVLARYTRIKGVDINTMVRAFRLATQTFTVKPEYSGSKYL